MQRAGCCNKLSKHLSLCLSFYDEVALPRILSPSRKSVFPFDQTVVAALTNSTLISRSRSTIASVQPYLLPEAKCICSGANTATRV